MLDLKTIKKKVQEMTPTKRTLEILDIISRIEEGLSLDSYAIEYTTNHNDKMEGLQSLSTSPLVNSYCKTLSQRDTFICHYCFNQKQLKRFKNQDLKYIYNALLLNYCDLKPQQIPFINACYFRIEAFGDLNSMTQLKNYVKIIKNNPNTFFGWFTKNQVLFHQYLEDGGIIPNNCNLILSNPLINPSKFLSGVVKVFKGFQPNLNIKVFSVFDKNHIESVPYKDNQVPCQKKCKNCLICYTKNNTTSIIEALK